MTRQQRDRYRGTAWRTFFDTRSTVGAGVERSLSVYWTSMLAAELGPIADISRGAVGGLVSVNIKKQ